LRRIARFSKRDKFVDKSILYLLCTFTKVCCLQTILSSEVINVSNIITIKESLEKCLTQEEIIAYRELIDKLDFIPSDEEIALCSTTCITYK